MIIFLNVFVVMAQCNVQIYHEISMLLPFIFQFTTETAILLCYLIHCVKYNGRNERKYNFTL